MIVDKINAYLSTEGKPLDEALLLETGKLAAWAFNRQFGVREERKEKHPYFSSIGKCLRQQAYDLLGFEAAGKEIDARARMVFFQGDMAELAIVQLAKIAGCAVTQSLLDQESIEWKGLRGRPDGVIAGTHLLEVKSMASYGFERFEQGALDEGYRYQCNAGMQALGLQSAVIVALNKDAGVLAERVISKDAAVIADIEARLEILKNSTRESLPERPYAPDDKGFLPWNCLYCAYWKICWPNAQKILFRNKYKLSLQPTNGGTAK